MPFNKDKMLKTRLIFGAIFILAIVGMFCFDTWLASARGITCAPVFFVLVTLLVLGGIHEFCRLMRLHGWHVYEFLAAPAALLLILAALFHLTGRSLAWHVHPLDMGFTGIILTALVVLTLVAETVRVGSGGPLAKSVENIAATIMAFLYVGLLMSFVVAIRFIDGLPGLWCLAVFLAVAKLSDMGAYFTGSFLGKHKLCPGLSPNKTVEGLIGAFVFGIAAALALGLPLLSLAWWQLVVFGVVVTALAVLGDLAESLLKRAAAAKDSSTTFPAFGGVLDIIDSVLLSAPAAYCLFTVFANAKTVAHT